MQESQKNWFKNWFNSPYYHILYKDRDYTEAQLFIDNITNYLNLPEAAKVLDLACGRGRHSIYLNQLGYDVMGADLSVNNIEFAKQFENEKLHFQVQDMREPFEVKFDAIFNFFTSFGYFENEADHLTALTAIKASLKEYGFAVIDFMNVHKVIDNLVEKETKVVNEITFNIKRWAENGYIFKNIAFEHDNESYDFTEKVKAFTLEDFETLMHQAEIFLLDIFGDYKLNKFHKNESDRLIMIFK
ncbi:SAM-dependent methyltransferase [Paenimyroides aestuarii]|uniref:Methyltransferase domain-containing protein n=1 Tax=Paenimyroides aestuarii TaxID=2968490 RepID=A0ABY5NR47_9FLAO|nr:class I SAM-dependent methyltransferase [Paenimyroides aestuarii]UUV21037.1 methyltransferase domain-containing protein [Paenimyroides aestuarii]